ncbi:S-adenosylmethionine synthase [Candidatus Jidaibacter acanthamoeba]|uniref:S-adenosylmethionine synthase n=2 Tax=Candidatus Jidaibacter acanthamoebae TaxID=86105 RepID=A0A0C1MW75_9RICK|nr:S-adenosylmethionine synthase [Candidatus Jidaibacter acanthamoeba]
MHMGLKRNSYLFTSESVAEGHPDKVCDQISDSILDTFIESDPNARVACETMVVPNHVILGGEISSTHLLSREEIERVVRNKIKEIGYEQDNFHWKTVKVLNFIGRQSPDIALGVDSSKEKEEGAGDQGLMFGYACGETEDLMPAPIIYAHRILENISVARKLGKIQGLYSDAKSQVTLLYDEEGLPLKATDVVVSIQHHASLTQAKVKEIIYPYVEATLPKGWMCEYDRLLVNPTGKFVIGGPESDAGLTGRKIIVDTYGGAAPHGGGAFSGKDPTKVDRSAAYAARYLAKNIVASGVAKKCLIQISYAIGVSRPVSIYVNTYGTGEVKDREIALAAPQIMDLTPKGIRIHLDLNKPIYSKTATYGHFGRKPDEMGHFTWEKIDLIEKIKSYLA